MLTFAVIVDRTRSVEADSRLGERDREILREVIVSYVSTGEPVSSRTLSKQRNFELSPATIRNIMADLEDLGYLAQPHTSAGRVPTDRGYRLFVDVLMSPRRVSSREQEMVDANLVAAAPDQGPILQTAGRLLSELTDQVAVVVAPAAAGSAIRSVHFVRVSEQRFLAVLVTEANLVDHRLVVHPEDFTQRELDRLSRVLTDEFGGRTLSQMRDRVVSAMVEEKERWEAELGRLLPLADRALEQEEVAVGNDVVVEGTSRMMAKPEFADVEKMRRIFRAFEEKATLAALLTGCLDEPGPKVLIGSENDFTGGMDLSVVATGWTVDGRPAGSLGIVGPRRMDYSRLLPLVEYIGRSLGHRMATESTGDRERRDDQER